MRHALAGLFAVVLCVACGAEAPHDPASAPSPGRWSHAVLEGVAEARALAVLDGRLLVGGGNVRVLHVVDTAALRPGFPAAVRTIPVQIDEEGPLGGADSLARVGYPIGMLWTLPLRFEALAAHAPLRVYLGDASHRVVYAGRLLERPDGSWSALRVERAFTVPGAERKGEMAGDWRDQGPGLVGLDSVQGARRAEDLYVVDRSTGEPGTLRFQKLDRYGLVLGSLRVRLQNTLEAEAVVEDGGRYLVLHGEGRGLLAAFRDGPRGSDVSAGRSVPGPVPEGDRSWRGMARAEDGTLYLVSDGDPAIVAWRSP